MSSNCKSPSSTDSNIEQYFFLVSLLSFYLITHIAIFQKMTEEKVTEEKKRVEKKRVEKKRVEKKRVEKKRVEKKRVEKKKVEKKKVEKKRVEKKRVKKKRVTVMVPSQCLLSCFLWLQLSTNWHKVGFNSYNCTDYCTPIITLHIYVNLITLYILKSLYSRRTIFSSEYSKTWIIGKLLPSYIVKGIRLTKSRIFLRSTSGFEVDSRIKHYAGSKTMLFTICVQAKETFSFYTCTLYTAVSVSFI